ncbi:hypothetical protein HELRODRAFT_183710 [Helobdella robusta]|uniref:Uncharacterized protein n=1 Tax=Helobdella robusta TaxID=6412 RepID=T1FK34_HELRO|nr:hypothetical protein HELRODRAFT_183710 [Helobdella robusta]ESO10339.1 hypothetical protein HELRODRAFT_183710 [Helobdella robusta]
MNKQIDMTQSLSTMFLPFTTIPNRHIITRNWRGERLGRGQAPLATNFMGGSFKFVPSFSKLIKKTPSVGVQTKCAVKCSLSSEAFVKWQSRAFFKKSTKNFSNFSVSYKIRKKDDSTCSLYHYDDVDLRNQLVSRDDDSLYGDLYNRQTGSLPSLGGLGLKLDQLRSELPSSLKNVSGNTDDEKSLYNKLLAKKLALEKKMMSQILRRPPKFADESFGKKDKKENPYKKKLKSNKEKFLKLVATSQPNFGPCPDMQHKTFDLEDLCGEMCSRQAGDEDHEEDEKYVDDDYNAYQDVGNDDYSKMFLDDYRRLVQYGDLRPLLCEIIRAARNSRTTNLKLFLARYLEAKFDGRLYIENLSDDEEKSHHSFEFPKITNEDDNDYVQFILYESLKNLHFCPARMEDRTVKAKISDSEICSNSSENTKTSFLRVRQKKINLSCRVKKKKPVKPVEIDLGEQPFDEEDELAYLKYLIQKKNLNRPIEYEVRDIKGTEQTVAKDFIMESPFSHLFNLQKHREKSPVKKLIDISPTWHAILKKHKKDYDKWKKNPRGEIYWEPGERFNKERIVLLPPKIEKVTELSDYEKERIAKKRAFCTRRLAAEMKYNESSKKEMFNALKSLIDIEREFHHDKKLPLEDTVPDQPAEFPTSHYEELLAKEKKIRQEATIQSTILQETLAKIKRKKSKSLLLKNFECRKDCTHDDDEDDYRASLAEDAPDEEDENKSAIVKKNISLLNSYSSCLKDIGEWKCLTNIIQNIIRNSLKNQISYLAEQIIVQDKKSVASKNASQLAAPHVQKFSEKLCVCYFRHLLVQESNKNKIFKSVLESMNENLLNGILVFIGQGCTNLNSMLSWELSTSDYKYTGLNETLLKEEDMWPFVANWEDFFKQPKKLPLTLRDDFGRAIDFFSDLENQDPMCSTVEPLQPINLMKIENIWQDLPSTQDLVGNTEFFEQPVKDMKLVLKVKDLDPNIFNLLEIKKTAEEITNSTIKDLNLIEMFSNFSKDVANTNSAILSQNWGKEKIQALFIDSQESIETNKVRKSLAVDLANTMEAEAPDSLKKPGLHNMVHIEESDSSSNQDMSEMIVNRDKQTQSETALKDEEPAFRQNRLNTRSATQLAATLQPLLSALNSKNASLFSSNLIQKDIDFKAMTGQNVKVTLSIKTDKEADNTYKKRKFLMDQRRSRKINLMLNMEMMGRASHSNIISDLNTPRSMKMFKKPSLKNDDEASQADEGSSTSVVDAIKNLTPRSTQLAFNILYDKLSKLTNSENQNFELKSSSLFALNPSFSQYAESTFSLPVPPPTTNHSHISRSFLSERGSISEIARTMAKNKAIKPIDVIKLLEYHQKLMAALSDANFSRDTTTSQSLNIIKPSTKVVVYPSDGTTHAVDSSDATEDAANYVAINVANDVVAYSVAKNVANDVAIYKTNGAAPDEATNDVGDEVVADEDEKNDDAVS